VLHDAALAATGVSPATKVGPECRDCKARHACPTLQEAAYEAVEFTGQSMPFDMPVEAKGRELAIIQQRIDILKARADGLEAEVLTSVKQGTQVVGWMARQGKGRKKWDKPVEEVLALGTMMGVDVSKPGLITPTQAVKAGIPQAVVDSYAVAPNGEISLVRDTGAFARKIFQGVK